MKLRDAGQCSDFRGMHGTEPGSVILKALLCAVAVLNKDMSVKISYKFDIYLSSVIQTVDIQSVSVRMLLGNVFVKCQKLRCPLCPPSIVCLWVDIVF